MLFRRLAIALSTLLCVLPMHAQDSGVEVDYNRPRKYVLGGINVEGNNYFSAQQIIQITGLREGMDITVPSEEVNAVVRRLWLQRYFEDVSMNIDRVEGDKVWFVVKVVERPRVSRWAASLPST